MAVVINRSIKAKPGKAGEPLDVVSYPNRGLVNSIVEEFLA